MIAALSSETRFRVEATADKDAQKFQRDLEALPQDVGVDSEAYDRIPIHEFGAAMLREMGWRGAAAASSSSSSAPAAPATPTDPASVNGAKHRFNETNGSHSNKPSPTKHHPTNGQYEESQNVQTEGSAWLNRVLVCFEGEANDVRKGDITLVDQSDFESKTFREAAERKQTTESKGSDQRESDKKKHKERETTDNVQPKC